MTQEARQAADIIKKQLPDFQPELAIVLGSGLGHLAEHIESPVYVAYESLPGFHKPVVEGHSGRFVLGYLNGVAVVCLQGRVHLYEGVSPTVVQTIVRTCALLGCKIWFATNASGSLRESVGEGSLVMVTDHINFQFVNPLVGVNDDTFGPRFVAMENAYDQGLRDQLQRIAQQKNIRLEKGVYLGVLGPSFETPAEIHAFKKLGADLVGMSTIAEVIVARHCGLKVACVSVVTNLAAGLHPTALSHEGTLQGAKVGAQQLTDLLSQFVKNYPS